MNKYGLNFPFRNNGRGSVEYSNSLTESINSNITQIVLTKKMERPMNPEFGCDAWKVAFDYDEYTINELVKEYVTQAINRWEDRINVEDVITEKNSETLNINILYSIKSSNLGIQSANVQLYRN